MGAEWMAEFRDYSCFASRHFLFGVGEGILAARNGIDARGWSVCNRAAREVSAAGGMNKRDIAAGNLMEFPRFFNDCPASPKSMGRMLKDPSLLKSNQLLKRRQRCRAGNASSGCCAGWVEANHTRSIRAEAALTSRANADGVRDHLISVRFTCVTTGRNGNDGNRARVQVEIVAGLL
jgi:hypothetical protein